MRKRKLVGPKRFLSRDTIFSAQFAGEMGEKVCKGKDLDFFAFLISRI
jgi:hypothetical protein